MGFLGLPVFGAVDAWHIDGRWTAPFFDVSSQTWPYRRHWLADDVLRTGGKHFTSRSPAALESARPGRRRVFGLRTLLVVSGSALAMAGFPISRLLPNHRARHDLITQR